MPESVTPMDAALNDLAAHMNAERITLATMIEALHRLSHPDPLMSEAFNAYRAAGVTRPDYQRLHWRARKAFGLQYAAGAALAADDTAEAK